jgi:hypothetical protein
LAFQFDSPDFATNSVVKLAAELFGIKTTAKLLPSERDQNKFYKTTPLLILIRQKQSAQFVTEKLAKK